MGSRKKRRIFIEDKKLLHFFGLFVGCGLLQYGVVSTHFDVGGCGRYKVFVSSYHCYFFCSCICFFSPVAGRELCGKYFSTLLFVDLRMFFCLFCRVEA